MKPVIVQVSLLYRLNIFVGYKTFVYYIVHAWPCDHNSFRGNVEVGLVLPGVSYLMCLFESGMPNSNSIFLDCTTTVW